MHNAWDVYVCQCVSFLKVSGRLRQNLVLAIVRYQSHITTASREVKKQTTSFSQPVQCTKKLYMIEI